MLDGAALPGTHGGALGDAEGADAGAIGAAAGATVVAAMAVASPPGEGEALGCAHATTAATIEPKRQAGVISSTP
jgi:hypothetical protein